MAGLVGQFQQTAGNAEFVTKGSLGVAGHFTDNRKFSLSDLIVWNERRWAKLDNVLRAMGSMVPVDDPEPKVIQSVEAPIKFSMTQTSSSTNFDQDTFVVTNIDAVFLQPGDILEVSGSFCDANGTLYSTTKFGVSGSTQLFAETVVVQKVLQGGFSGTEAEVIVFRGNGQNKDAPATGTVTTLTSANQVVHLGNALVDGGNAPIPIHFEPSHVQNFNQFFSRTWSMTTSEMPLNTYGKLSMEDRAAMKRKEFFRLKELAMFRGRKGKLSVAGKDQWLTGGMTEFVSGAADSLDGEARLIDFGGPFDLDGYMEKSEIIGRYGSDVKDAFVGGKFLSSLWNHFQQSIIFNDEISQQYGWAVWQLDLGHMILMLHRHPMFTDVSTTATDYNFDAAFIDLEYIKQMVYIDVMTRDDVQQPNTHRQDNEIFCQVGLWRTFADAHAYIHGITG